MTYEAVTDGVRVVAEPVYLDDQSSPEENYFVWAYKIRIENGGARTLRLRSRHWTITDALGRIQEVKGVGVIGQQPRLAPGERFEYASGCPLSTPSGIMVGSYQMEDDAGGMIDIAVPAFSLDSPHQPRHVQ